MRAALPPFLDTLAELQCTCNCCPLLIESRSKLFMAAAALVTFNSCSVPQQHHRVPACDTRSKALPFRAHTRALHSIPRAHTVAAAAAMDAGGDRAAAFAAEEAGASPPPSGEQPVFYTHTLCPYAERVWIALLEKVTNFWGAPS